MHPSFACLHIHILVHFLVVASRVYFAKTDAASLVSLSLLERLRHPVERMLLCVVKWQEKEGLTLPLTLLRHCRAQSVALEEIYGPEKRLRSGGNDGRTKCQLGKFPFRWKTDELDRARHSQVS